MSADTKLLAALLAFAPLRALVVERVARNAVPPNTARPYVVFSTAHEPQLGLGGQHFDQVSFSIECWGDNAAQSTAVADQVIAAIETYEAAQPLLCAMPTGRVSGFDGDLGLDAEVIMVDWIDQAP